MLTKEIEEIMHGCGQPYGACNSFFCGEKASNDDTDFLCDVCQAKLSTAKKLSIMWADFILNYKVNKIDDLVDELKEIKSLMEKA
jgi:hypothetical protein